VTSQILGYFPSQTILANRNFLSLTYSKISSFIWAVLSIIFCVGFFVQRILNASNKSHQCFQLLVPNEFFHNTMAGWTLAQCLAASCIRIDCLRNSSNLTQLYSDLEKLLLSSDSENKLLISSSDLLHLKKHWTARALLYIFLGVVFYAFCIYINLDVLNYLYCPVELLMDRFWNVAVSAMTTTHNFSLHTLEIYLQLLNLSIKSRILDIQSKLSIVEDDTSEKFNLFVPIKMIRNDLKFTLELQKSFDRFNQVLDTRMTLETLNFVGIGSLLSYFIITNVLPVFNYGPVVSTFCVLGILVHGFYKFCEVATDLTTNFESLAFNLISACENHNIPVKN